MGQDLSVGIRCRGVWGPWVPGWGIKVEGLAQKGSSGTQLPECVHMGTGGHEPRAELWGWP